MDTPISGLKSVIEDEIREYLNGTVNISQDVKFSQSKLVRRISLFENKTYPTGKFDSAKNYKFWYDIIQAAVDSEVKNVDFDRKNILAYSPRTKDALCDIITNLKLDEYLRTTGQGEEINSAIEEGAGWGNIVWKKVKGGYERVDLKNFYVINQTAENLNQTPVIERHQYSQSELREMTGVWKNVKEVIEGCKENSYSNTIETQAKDTTVPYYEILERNGEVNLKKLKEEKNIVPAIGDENKYVFAKVIGAGKKGNQGGISIEYIVYAEEMPGKENGDIYEEYHRGRYKGRWFREGLYELLFDVQIRANQIGNQIAQGLEYASKIIFRYGDKQTVQNILSDMRNGEMIKSIDLQQVEVRLQGFDQLANDWNRMIALRNEIANSNEVVQGITPPSGTPLGTSQMMNQNSNKLYDFIREKIAIPFSQIFEQWIIPEQISDMKSEEILRLTGDSKMMDRLYEMVVGDWYLRNLINIGPHTQEIADTLKEAKMEELKKKSHLLMTGLKDIFNDYKPHVSVIITGENSRLPEEMDALATFIPLEVDPARRSALVDLAMRKKGIDVGSLPKFVPVQPMPTQLPQQTVATK